MLAGCGNSSRGDTELRITRDFGQKSITASKTSELRPGATALRQLQLEAKIDTAYSGRFITGINGVKQNTGSGMDWLFYVDGVESNVGAGSWRLRDGEVVQWDYHRWMDVQTGGAIVGAFPRPLTSRGVQIECADGSAAACTKTRAAIDAPTTGKKRVRVRVGAWLGLASMKDIPNLSEGPAGNGAFAAIEPGRIDLVDQTGRISRTLGAGSGLVAAFKVGDDLQWVITGVDAAGVERAAGLLNEKTLGGRFAVAVGPDGQTFSLPLVNSEPGG
ncbi:MAG TPA: DUF4430 domain-containing protein [Chthoniobacteraceae bacterium]|jgi:hypothetical protein|nr:DUF4430 domain-containing protein [Chthoniobacteraceae bacterium]